MAVDELTCRELVALVTDYLEGALSPAARARLEGHLAACGPCRDYLEQMRRTIQAVGRVTEDDVPPAAEADLRRVFRAWKRGEDTGRAGAGGASPGRAGTGGANPDHEGTGGADPGHAGTGGGGAG